MVRPTERRRLFSLMGLAALLMAGQSIGLAVSDSLLLSRLGVAALPQAMMWGSVITILASTLYSGAVGLVPNRRLLGGLLTLATGLLVVAYMLVGRAYGWLYIGLYAFYGASFTVFYSHLFSLAGDYMDTLTSKRLFPLLGVGATLGELLGGLLASLGGSWLGAEALLLVWAACYLLAGVWMLSLLPGRQARGGRRPGVVADLVAGTRFLARSRLGLALTTTVVTMTLSLTVAQYLISAQFVAAYPQADHLAAFLGRFMALTNLFELVWALTVTPWLISRLGVGGAGLVHPALTVLGLTWLSLQPFLGSAMAAWMVRKSFQDCLASPIRSLAFNGLPGRFRQRARAVITGMVGSCAQALAALVLAWGRGRLSVGWLGGLAVALSVGYLGAGLWIRRAYLSTLLEGLEAGRLRLSHSPASAAPATRLEPWQTLAESGDPVAHLQLSQGLADADPRVRTLAARSLSGLGPDALSWSREQLLSGKRFRTESAALEAIAGADTEPARRLLRLELHTRVRQAWQDLLAVDSLQPSPTMAVAHEFLRAALEDRAERNRRHALHILELLEGRERVEGVRWALRPGMSSRRAEALEVVSHLGTPETAQLLVLLLEGGALGERLQQAATALGTRLGPQEVLERALLTSDRWVRRAAGLVAGSPQPWKLIRPERYLALRGLPWFARQTLDELEELEQSVIEEHYPADQVLAAGRYYCVLEGRVQVGRHELGPGAGFGSPECLDDGPQLYPARSLQRVRWLGRAGPALRAQVQRCPEIALEIFRGLVAQVREAEAASVT